MNVGGLTGYDLMMENAGILDALGILPPGLGGGGIGGGGGNGPIGQSPFSNQMGPASPGRSPGETVLGPPPPAPAPSPPADDGDDDDDDDDPEDADGGAGTATAAGAAAAAGALAAAQQAGATGTPPGVFQPGPWPVMQMLQDNVQMVTAQATAIANLGPGDLVILSGNTPDGKEGVFVPVKRSAFEDMAKSKGYAVSPIEPTSMAELALAIDVAFKQNKSVSFRRILVISHAGGRENAPALNLGLDRMTSGMIAQGGLINDVLRSVLQRACSRTAYSFWGAAGITMIRKQTKHNGCET